MKSLGYRARTDQLLALVTLCPVDADNAMWSAVNKTDACITANVSLTG